MRTHALAILLAAAAVAAPGSAAAEAGGGLAAAGVTGGLKGGVNASRWFGLRGSSMHLGVGLGGFASIPLAGPLSLQTEFLLHEKGADFEDFQGDSADEGLLYLEAPVLARYDLALLRGVTGYATAGPGIAWVIDSKRTAKSELNKLDVTVHAALGARLDTGSEHKIDVELRGSLGLLDLLDRAQNDETARNSVLGLFAGVTL